MSVARYAACVEYDGSGYCGWQRQVHSPSVQARVEEALSRVASHPVEVACAGRTDTGVHATSQIIHFDSTAPRSARNWLLGATSNLPSDIAVQWVHEVPPDFHARFSALSRTYRYLILCANQRPAIGYRGVTQVRADGLNLDAMRQAAPCLLGEQDFSSFRGAGCQSKTPFRRVDRVDFGTSGALIIFEIQANAFLLHMVRNIVGALLQVGTDQMSPAEFKQLLGARDRRLGPPTAPPQGLYLTGVEYHSKFMLPEVKPLWFAPESVTL